MKDWTLKFAGCCLIWFIVSPAIAADSTPSPLVVIERAEFVKLLGEIDYLRQREANKDAEIDARIGQWQAIQAQAQALKQALEAKEAELEKEREARAIVTKDRDRLAQELEHRETWDTIKSYGLVFLGALAVAALAL